MVAQCVTECLHLKVAPVVVKATEKFEAGEVLPPTAASRYSPVGVVTSGVKPH